MKTITRLYILQVFLIGAIAFVLMLFKISGDRKLNLFLKSSQVDNENIVKKILKINQDVFMQPLHDNSEWDETVKYIDQPTKDFEQECLNSLLATFSFNHLWLFDKNSKCVYYVNDSNSLNLDTIISVDLINKLLIPKMPFCHFFINVNNKLIEVIGATVVSTFDIKHSFPAQGYLFFGKIWDTAVIHNLEAMTGSKVLVKMADFPTEQTGIKDAYTITCDLTDIQNRTVAKLEFAFPTTFFQEWQKESAILTIITIFIGLCVILSFGFLSRKWLMIPLKSIKLTLNTGEIHYLKSLKSSKSEFGEMARLIYDFIITKNALQDELKNKMESERVLIHLKNKAEESDRLKTAFLSNMSHEIRTPMNCILGFTQVLEQEDCTQEERIHYMSLINSSGKQLLDIINDVLDFSRIESKQMILQPVHFDLNGLLERLFVHYNDQMQKAGKNEIVFELEKGIPDERFQIYCDSVRLEQVIINLLSNAIKFTQRGKISFGYSIERENLMFFFHDTGIGISAQNQEVIFERFRQEEETHTKKTGGIGLGLPISKGLIELMGGKLWLTSEKGIGSSFYFTLPDVIRNGIMIPDEIIHTKKLGLNFSGKTILVAEDVHENIELIITMLKDTHVNILLADNGLVAVNLCKENHSIDLVLMDIRMPVMNGYEATREIKKLRPELPVIAITAYAFDKDKKNSEEAGCNDFIAKPISKNDLLQKLYSFLGSNTVN